MTAAAPRQASFLALGDSYTIGEGVDPQDAWPAQLVRALRAERFRIGDPLIIAETGWTAAETDRALQERGLEGPFGLVTVLSGVNNQYRGMILRTYRGQLRRLIHHAVRLTRSPGAVIVVSLPDWGVTPYNTRRVPSRVARQINSYNRVAREEALASDAHWVDITDLSRADPSAVTGDGLHPNAAMYARWVERLLPAARDVLARNKLWRSARRASA